MLDEGSDMHKRDVLGTVPLLQLPGIGQQSVDRLTSCKVCKPVWPRRAIVEVDDWLRQP
jgi:hypothetical protein